MRSINRIGRKDTIKAYSYDKNRKLITSLYDSGFHSIEEIVNRLNFSFGVRRRGERTLSSSLLRLLGGIEHESSFSVLSPELFVTSSGLIC